MIPLTWMLSKLLLLCIDMLFSIQKHAFFVLLSTNRLFSIQKSFSAMAVTLCVLCFLWTNRLFPYRSRSLPWPWPFVFCVFSGQTGSSPCRSRSLPWPWPFVFCVFSGQTGSSPCRSRSLPWPWSFVFCVFSVQTGSFHTEVVLCHGRDPLCFVLHSIRQCPAWGNWHDVRTDQADRGTHHLCSGWRCRLAGAGNKQNMYIFKYIKSEMNLTASIRR